MAPDVVNDKTADDEELSLRNLRSGNREMKSEHQDLTHKELSRGFGTWPVEEVSSGRCVFRAALGCRALRVRLSFSRT